MLPLEAATDSNISILNEHFQLLCRAVFEFPLIRFISLYLDYNPTIIQPQSLKLISFVAGNKGEC